MFKKWAKILVLPILILVAFIAAISFKALHPFKPTILNYAQYTSPKQIETINKKYTYKEYKGIEQFNYSLENDKAIAGIGADYTIVGLIKKNKIQKINFKANFNVDNPMPYYTEAVQKQLRYFDQFLVGIDNDKDGQDDKFYEYIIPYFINTKVLAINLKKSKILASELTKYDKASLLDALQFLAKKGITIFGWNDTKIENTILGSNSDKLKITIDNYKNLINNFAQILKKGTGYQINNSDHNIFEPDSDVLLQNIINPRSAIQVANIYNGDALDAYYSEDNFATEKDSEVVHSIKINNSPSILDCFVISNSISEEVAQELIKFLNPIIFEGTYMDYSELSNKLVDKKGKINYDKLGIARNFDYVNYTPVAKGIYNFILDNYFDDDKHAEYIYQINKEEINPIAPISDETRSSLNIYFKAILSK